MPNDKERTTIDNKLTRIEIKGPNLTWKELYESAQSAIRKATGFKGKFSKESDVNKYFATYRLEPITKQGNLQGIMAVYAINKQPAEKRKRYASGCGSFKSEYNF